MFLEVYYLEITLADIGFEIYRESTLFRKLFPATAVLVLAVFQLKNFFEQFDYPEFELPVILLELFEFCKRFLILHSPKATVFVIWYVVVSSATAFHFMYPLLSEY
jgi:hypothetical protein